MGGDRALARYRRLRTDFRDWQQGATSFSALAAWSGGRATVIGGREPVVTGVYAATRVAWVT